MKKFMLLLSFSCLAIMGISTSASAGSPGCPFATGGQWPTGAAFVPTCTGVAENITTNGWAGEYSVVAVQAGTAYTFASSVATDFLTITDSTGTVVYASGVTPITFTALVSEDLRMYNHTDSLCGDENVSRTRSVSCPLPVCLTATSGQWPTGAAFVPACTGTPENITTIGWAGEYSLISVVAGETYVFASSVATDFLTIADSSGTTAYAAGITPVVYVATVTEDIRFYNHLDENCGGENVNRTRSVLCQTGAVGCLTASFGDWPNTTFVPACVDTPEVITTNGWAGEYSVVNVTAGISYTFASSIATDYLTISDPAGSIIYASGMTPVSYLATASEDLRFYNHVDSLCGEETASRTRTVSCALPICLVATSGQWPTGAAFVPVCDDSAEVITTNGWAGEYSVVTVVAGATYTFASSVATDHLTIGDASGTTAYVSGTTPVTYVATVSEDLRFYNHTNVACGDENVSRTRTVTCFGLPAPCDSVVGTMTSNVAPTSAMLSWTANANAQAYRVRGRQVGSATFDLIETTTSTSLTISGLTVGVNYEWQVQAICDTTNGIVGPWSANNLFTTACMAPMNPNTTNITASSATLNWDAVAGAVSYKVLGRKVGGGIVTLNVGNVTSFTPGVTLSPSTAYEWGVKAVCSNGGVMISPISATVQFTTLASFNRLAGPETQETEISVYPNPASSHITVSGLVSETAKIEIFDMSGRMVKAMNADDATLTISTENLVNGVYQVVVLDNQTHQVVKVVVAK